MGSRNLLAILKGKLKEKYFFMLLADLYTLSSSLTILNLYLSLKHLGAPQINPRKLHFPCQSPLTPLAHSY